MVCSSLHTYMHVVQDEQDFLLDCPLYTAIREHVGLLARDQGSICWDGTKLAFASFWSTLLSNSLVLLATFTLHSCQDVQQNKCLPTPDCHIDATCCMSLQEYHDSSILMPLGHVAHSFAMGLLRPTHMNALGAMIVP